MYANVLYNINELYYVEREAEEGRTLSESR